MIERIARSGTVVSHHPWVGRDGVLYVLAADGLDDIVRGGAQELGNDGKLIDVVFAREQRLSLQHLGEDASSTPYIHLHIILLPREHNLRRAIVSRGHVSRHLRILDAGQAKVADLEIAIFIDENIAWLEVTMDDPGGVNVFEAPLCLINSGDGGVVKHRAVPVFDRGSIV